MVSRLARRSGVAVVQVAELLSWTPDVVWHVGVGLEHGEVSIMKKEVWPEVRFVGFEPSPRARKSIMEEGYPGELYPYALGNRIGPGTLYAPHLHADGCSIFQKDDSDKQYSIEMTTLDEMLKVEPLKPSEKVLLWLDCEGSELEVLEGGKNFISCGIDFINIELTSKPKNKDWADALTLHNWLQARGYKRQFIHTHRIHCGQSDGIYVREHLWKEEFCCCPCQSGNIWSSTSHQGCGDYSLTPDSEWKWPPWLKARWIAMDKDGTWWAFHGNDPVPLEDEGTWDWGASDTCHLSMALALDRDMFDFDPPPCSDWTKSLRELVR